MDKQDLRGMSAIITGGSTEVAGSVALALAREGVQSLSLWKTSRSAGSSR